MNRQNGQPASAGTMTKRAAPSATDDAARLFLINVSSAYKIAGLLLIGRPRRATLQEISNRDCAWLCESLGICRDVCAGCATPKAFAATSAQVAQLPKHLPRQRRRLRRSQSICRDGGAGCADPKAFAKTAAQVAPIPKHLPRHRRRLRNSQSICRDVCAGCATPKAFAAASAQVAQLPKHLPRRLRRLRNSQSICRDIGAGCAAMRRSPLCNR